MNLQQRKALLLKLGNYMMGKEASWQAARAKAHAQNPWFIPEFMDLAITNIVQNYLQPAALDELTGKYSVPEDNASPRKVGIVMAGNIPLVGFHDLLCVFLSGHIAFIKASSKDEVLIKFLVAKMTEWDDSIPDLISFSEMIKNCDAYIATGNNNTSRYFDYYFGKYPSIIRRNRTSVAVLSGRETEEELGLLADDVYQYFGLGCRNVTKMYVPRNYDFIPLLRAFKKYNYLADHNKYRNNYDYNLAVHILNNRYFMSNESLLVVEDESLFSPIAQLHYQFYTDEKDLGDTLQKNKDVQCLVGSEATRFGGAQTPSVCDYADGVDTMKFLTELH